MKELRPGMYFYKKDGVTQLWHDCGNYRGRPKARVELFIDAATPSTATYACPYCDFEYTLDTGLNLEAVKGVRHEPTEGVLPEPEEPKKRKRRFLGIF